MVGLGQRHLVDAYVRAVMLDADVILGTGVQHARVAEVDMELGAVGD